jgi:hypothetical protein
MRGCKRSDDADDADDADGEDDEDELSRYKLMTR